MSNLPTWVTTEPVYVTLVDTNPDAVRTIILVERPASRIWHTHRYEQVAVVLHFEEGVIRVNGEPLDFGGAEVHAAYIAQERLCELADVALSNSNANGSGFYFDPDES